MISHELGEEEGKEEKILELRGEEEMRLTGRRQEESGKNSKNGFAGSGDRLLQK